MSANERAALIHAASFEATIVGARGLAAAGFNLALVVDARERAAVEEFALELRASGRSVVVLDGDPGGSDDATALVARACTAMGPLSLLVDRGAGPLATAFVAGLPEGSTGAIVLLVDDAMSSTRDTPVAATRDLARSLAPRARVNAIRYSSAGFDAADLIAAIVYLAGAGAVTGQIIRLAETA